MSKPLLDPAFELWCLAYIQAVQQRTPIHARRLLKFPALQRHLELDGVTRDPREVEADVLRATAEHHVGSERLSQEVDGLSERRPSVTLVDLRPEQPDDSVTSVEATRPGHGQVAEECHPLTMGQRG
ncbi:MAG: hypothetical protein P8X82_10430 [Gemmatimonadales bacterium]